MWRSRKNLATHLSQKLLQLCTAHGFLGISTQAERDCLAWQLVASQRRLDFTELKKDRPQSNNRSDPNHYMFDPESAAIIHFQNGDLDEAVWITFLSTHFGRNKRHGWLLMRNVYSGLGTQNWTWVRVSNDLTGFKQWIASNITHLKGGFGNHRKYESLKAVPSGTGEVVDSYVQWVKAHGSHSGLIGQLVRESGNDPHTVFDHFYSKMRVKRFGRLAKFDFLALLGRLNLAPIEPGLPYFKGATGPLAGARLLILGDANDASLDAVLDQRVQQIGNALGLGMQVMEDALCNWQKSPKRFVHFLG